MVTWDRSHLEGSYWDNTSEAVFILPSFLLEVAPDFRKEHLFQAVIDLQGRERRFGLTGEQVAPR